MNMVGHPAFSVDPRDYIDSIINVLDMRYNLAQEGVEHATDPERRQEWLARMDEVTKLSCFVRAMRDCLPDEDC